MAEADKQGGRQAAQQPQEEAVTVDRDESVVGGQIKAPRSGKALKEALVHQEDADLHPDGEPKDGMDKTSYPGGGGPGERPPLATAHPDVPIVQSLATGAGQHQPPDPEEFDEMGRPRRD